MSIFFTKIYRNETFRDEIAIGINAIFQILGTNTVIVIGLLLTRKFESTYAILEYILDTSYILAVLIISGLIFDWFLSIPFWYLVFMGIAIYLVSVFVNIVRNRNDIDEINKLLKKRKEKNTNPVT